MAKRKTAKKKSSAAAAESGTSQGVLSIDVGGSKVKILASGETEPRRERSGNDLTPQKLVEIVQTLAKGWKYDKVSIGYPGLVGPIGPRSEPGNLGPGWVGFDYSAAFSCPVRIMNDAAMQALGSYDGGRMLFLGLGTGLGSCLIAENVVVSLELGQLLMGERKTLGELLSKKGMKRLGRKNWRKKLIRVLPSLISAFEADSVVLGGGNAKYMADKLPAGVRLGHNFTAFRGGFRLWHLDMPEHNVHSDPMTSALSEPDWKLL